LDPNANFSGRDFVYCEQARDGVLTGCDFLTMVRDRTHKLVHVYDSPDGQLFDLRSDPDELENRWHDPSAAVDKQRLLDQLLRWRIQSGLRTKDWSQDWR
jgi:arylsulfatase A-like enzyme